MRPLLIAGALALGVAGVAMAPVQAQAQAQPDFKKAAEHYKAAEAAMAAELYLDAAREYAIAYEITRDAVLFFKIATANDKGGKCEIAVTYYRRYLKEGKPDDEYRKLTEQRIAVCEGTTSQLGQGKPATSPTPPAPAPPAPAPTPTPAPPAPATQTQPVPTPADTAAQTEPAAEPSTEWKAEAVPTENVGAGGGPTGPSALQSAGWIAIGVGAAAATVGAVMALSANSTQQDIEDLEAQRDVEGGRPPFDADMQARYEELVDEGERFNTLTIVSFSVAGVAAVTATTLFILGRSPDESDATALRIAPAIGPNSATVTAGFRF
jgi:hypothetical protein